ncbi:DUF309 domain-containing protein [Longirhabdus pacifica]|uniref:DUF309 domain-containing protein n=1 Tax=Longirhabdus pacifica TaxID=2305227 RepID=UPI0010090A4F|nr:DUF309 domain-containing protein [Longirhabdus pacifica]
MSAYDPLYVAFLYYFNVERDFYECHEVMEELWLEEGREPVYQGLLQIAVALHHHSYGNITGAIKLMEAGILKCESEHEIKLGIDLVQLLQRSRQYLIQLQRDDEFLFQPYKIEIVDLELENVVSAFQPKHSNSN